MRRTNAYALFGVLLVLLGVLFLLQNFGVIGFEGDWIWGLFWAAAFAAGGLIFLSVYLRNPEQWWAIIPGCTLLGLGAMIGLGVLFPAAGPLIGSLFFLAIAASFWIIYVTHREFWWAVIPAGVLTTLAFVTMAAERVDGLFVGSFFFLGLAATFGIVYALPTPEGRMRWAAWPAAACGLMGLMLLLFTPSLMGWVWPLVLIAVGAVLVVRVFVARKAE